VARYLIMEENKKTQWLVKDFDGEYIVITADSWTCGGNGLYFFVGEKKVAHFLRWSSYRELGV
jgi:hypothetical protein